MLLMIPTIPSGLTLLRLFQSRKVVGVFEENHPPVASCPHNMSHNGMYRNGYSLRCTNTRIRVRE